MKPYQSLEDELLNEQNLRHKLELDKREFCLQMREKELKNRAVIAVFTVGLVGLLTTGIPAYFILNSTSSQYPEGHFLRK